MPLIQTSIFAFSACYLGMSTQTTPLVKFNELRTNGAIIQEPYDYKYEVFYDGLLQQNNFRINVTLTFLSDDQYVTNLARGVGIGSAINAPPDAGVAKYSLLLVAPDDPVQNSYYFPVLWTGDVREVKYGKDTVTSTQIKFTRENRSANQTLFYQDSIQNLISVMGSKSPF